MGDPAGFLFEVEFGTSIEDATWREPRCIVVQSNKTMYSSAKYLLNQSRPLRTSCHK